MQAKFPSTFCGQHTVRLGNLGAGHAVFGISRVVHDLKTLPGFTQSEHAAGIVPAADLFRNLSGGALQILNQCEVIQVHDSAQLVRQLKFFRRRLIGREHDILPGDATPLRHDEFRQRGAVTPAALFFQKF